MSESNLPLWHRNLHFISLSQILFSHLVVNLEENCLYVYGSFIYCWGLKTNFGLQAPLSYYLMTLHTGICDVIFYEFPVGVINFCGKFQAIIVSTGNKLRLVESNHIAAVTPLLNELDEKDRYLLTSRFVEGKSYSSLSEDLGIQPDSVRMAVTRAKRKAAAILKRKYLTR